MTSELQLWTAYRAAAQAYMADRNNPARAADRLTAYSAWVRSYCPESADELIAEERARLGVSCAA